MGEKQHQPEGKGPSAGHELSGTASDGRTQRIMHTIINTTIVLASLMMAGMSKAMVEVSGAMASGMTEAVAGEEEAAKVHQEIQKKQPEVDAQVKEMISDVRKDIYAQMAERWKEIEPYLADPAFDKGPRMVDEHDFGLPKLNQELDDASLASYAQMLADEDPAFTGMFKDLVDWLESLPKPPEPADGHNPPSD